MNERAWAWAPATPSVNGTVGFAELLAFHDGLFARNSLMTDPPFWIWMLARYVF